MKSKTHAQTLDRLWLLKSVVHFKKMNQTFLDGIILQRDQHSTFTTDHYIASSGDGRVN